MKRWLTLTVIAALTLLIFSSCRIKTDKNNANTDTPGDSNIVYDNNTFPAIVKAKAASEEEATVDPDLMLDFSYKYQDAIGIYPILRDDTSEAGKNEIVLGDTSRDITKKALAILQSRMNRAISESNDERQAETDTVGYAIYSEGGSVAIVWTCETIIDYEPLWSLKLLQSEALNYFAENFFGGSSLALEDGYTKVKVFSMTSFLAERAEKIKEEKWEELEARLPENKSEEIINALKILYTTYDTDKLISYFANLYDPDTGAWYASNSARDTDGYLPTIEETWYGLGFSALLGAGELYDGDWAKALPDYIIDKAAKWLLGLQDENGFFYHPQWPKEYIEENGFESRLNRDTNSAKSMLSIMGVKPKYNLPSSVSKYGLPGKLDDTSSVMAVSKVVVTNGTSSRFSSAENFKKYLASLEAELTVALSDAQKAYKFYAWGNDFQSSYVHMNSEMKLLMKEFFDKHQNPENGHWSKELHFDSTNAIHKIANVYNLCGLELKYTDKMIESVIEALTLDPEKNPNTYIVDSYNAWSCFSYIYENVRKYSAGMTLSEREARVESYKAKVFDAAAVAIGISKENLNGFVYADGSFGYSRNTVGASGMSQGVPISVPGVKEGTVDGTLIATQSLILHIMSAFELSDCTVPLFTEADRYKYVTLLSGMGSVVKKEFEASERVVYDFEESDTFPVEMSLTQRNSTFAIESEDGNNYLSIEAPDWYGLEGWNTSKRNGDFKFLATVVDAKPNVDVIEMDIMFEDIINYTTGSIFMFARSGATIANFNLVGSKENDRYYVNLKDHDASAPNLGIKFPVGIWVNLRIEYYVTEGEFKIYVDGKLAARSDAVVTAGENLNSGSISLQGGAGTVGNTKLRVDNFIVERDNVEYTADDPIEEPSFELPVLGAPIYDFQNSDVGGKFPKDLSVKANNGEASVKALNTEKYLELIAKDHYTADSDFNTDKKNPSVVAHAYPVAEDGNAFSIGMTLKIDSLSSESAGAASSFMRLNLADEVGTQFMSYKLLYDVRDGETVIRFVDSASVSKTLAEFAEGEKVNLRIEYFPEKGTSNIYLNDKITGTVSGDTTALLGKITLALETSSNAKIHLDNLAVIRTSLAYSGGVASGESVEYDYTVIPEMDGIAGATYDFDGIETGNHGDRVALPEGITMNQSPAMLQDDAYAIVGTGGENRLNINAKDWYTHDSSTTKIRNPIFRFDAVRCSADPNAAVIAMDLKLNDAALDRHAFRFTLYDADGEQLISFYYTGSADNELSLFKDGAVKASAFTDTQSLTMVYLPDTGKLYVYVDSTLIKEYSTAPGFTLDRMVIESSTSHEVNIDIDNVTVALTTVTYPEIPKADVDYPEENPDITPPEGYDPGDTGYDDSDLDSWS